MWDDAPNYAGAGLTMKAPTGYGWCQGCGLTPYEDVVQHEGTMVGILNIPTNGWQYTRDTIPANTLAVINETANAGRLFLHYNNVLVSIFRTDPGVFQFPPPDSTFCDKRGFAIEAASTNEYSQATAADRLAAFRNDILTLSGVNTNYVRDAVNNRMIYTNRFGTVLDITYGLGGKIDGNPGGLRGVAAERKPVELPAADGQHVRLRQGPHTALELQELDGTHEQPPDPHDDGAGRRHRRRDGGRESRVARQRRGNARDESALPRRSARRTARRNCWPTDARCASRRRRTSAARAASRSRRATSSRTRGRLSSTTSSRRIPWRAIPSRTSPP